MNYLSLFTSLLVFLLFANCDKGASSGEARYAKAIENGITTNERNNNLFLGIQLGMSAKEFFDHCTDLNQQQIITEGTGGNRVSYKLKGTDYPAVMNFFPDFTKGTKDQPATMYAMDVEFNYLDWSPWNKDKQSVHLIRDITELMIDWYGGDFFVVPHEKLGRIVFQVRDNRRLALWIKDKSIVRGRFVDLSQVPQEPLIPFEPTIPTMTNDSLSINKK